MFAKYELVFSIMEATIGGPGRHGFAWSMRNEAALEERLV